MSLLNYGIKGKFILRVVSSKGRETWVYTLTTISYCLNALGFIQFPGTPALLIEPAESPTHWGKPLYLEMQIQSFVKQHNKYFEIRRFEDIEQDTDIVCYPSPLVCQCSLGSFPTNYLTLEFLSQESLLEDLT